MTHQDFSMTMETLLRTSNEQSLLLRPLVGITETCPDQRSKRKYKRNSLLECQKQNVTVGIKLRLSERPLHWGRLESTFAIRQIE